MPDQLLTFFHAHIGLFAALGAIAVAFIANEVHGALKAGAKLAPLDAVRLINDRDALVLDVRPHGDFKKSHLLNAVNMPLAKFADHVTEIGKDKSRPVIVYCALGSSQVEAAQTLRKLGHAEVYLLRGGLSGWLGANLPVTSK